MPALARKLLNTKRDRETLAVAVNCDGGRDAGCHRVSRPAALLDSGTVACSFASARRRHKTRARCGCSLAGRRDVGARFKTVARLLLLSLRFEGDGNVFQNRVRSQVPQGHRPARSSCRCMWWRTTCRTEPACWKPYSIKSPVRMDAGVDAADRSVFHYTNSGFASLASYESAAEQAC